MKSTTVDTETEGCQRCGDDGYDRRTLWMACFYAMEELGLPFEQRLMKGGTTHLRVGTEVLKGLQIPVPVWGPGEEMSPMEAGRSFYTLRVCKSCRGDWLAAIRGWFSAPKSDPSECGSGIFIRELGATREITEAEWSDRAGTRPPVRTKGGAS